MAVDRLLACGCDRVHMNKDDQDAALAHQAELEQRRLEEQALLKNDPDYEKWLDTLNEENDRGHVEVR